MPVHNPVTVMGAATSAAPNSAGAGDPVPIQLTLGGVQISRPYALPSQQNTPFTANPVAQGDTTAFAAVAGARNYVTGVQLSNGATASVIIIKDGAAGATLWQGTVAANQPVVDIEFAVPLRGSVNTAIVINSSAVGGTVVASMQGYNSVE